jgi:hypothetical protein
VGTLGAMDETDKMAGSECSVDMDMSLQIPEHANHDWITVLPVGLLTALIFSEHSMLGRLSLVW